jgi:hypothetical protein
MFFGALKWVNVVIASENWRVIKVINSLTRELSTGIVEYLRSGCHKYYDLWSGSD